MSSERKRSSGAPPVAGIDGNWQCQKCHNVNFARRTKCNVCETSRPASASGGGSSFGDVGYTGTRTPGMDERAYSFLLSFRSAYNPVQAAVEYLYSVDSDVQSGKPLLFQLAGAGGAYARGNGGGSFNDGLGKRRRMEGGVSAPPQAGVDGNWKCDACDNVNFARRTECNRCKKARPGDQGSDGVSA